MSKIKEAYRKLNPKAAVIGGALIITTSIGTCQLTREAVEEPAVEETPLVIEEPEVETEEVTAEEPEAPESE
tara:strand:+ start:473 stop:688 length:216 start_codon:yes stop_codon:yes gene_type:complete